MGKQKLLSKGIDQDRKDNDKWGTPGPGNTVYGGPTPEVCDSLRFKAKITGAKNCGKVTRYEWGCHDDPLFLPLGGETWTIGKISAFPAKTFVSLKVHFASGKVLTATDKFVKIGVRTSDIVTLGWINPAGVPLPVTGVDPRMTSLWPVDGKFTSFSHKINALGALAGISIIPTPPTYPSNGTIELMKRIDQDYWLRWLFKYGGNFEPPPDALPDERSIDRLVAAVTRFKLLNRCQFRYTMTDNALFPQIDSQSLYTIHQWSIIGSTTSPISIPGTPASFSGVAGPANMNSGQVATIFSSDLRLIGATSVTDGTPDSNAVTAFDSLTLDLGVRWEHIGMAIESLYKDRGASYVYNQKYPTYYIYSSGKLIEKRPQAPDPIANFNTRPYPRAINSTAPPFVRPKIRFYSP